MTSAYTAAALSVFCPCCGVPEGCACRETLDLSKRRETPCPARVRAGAAHHVETRPDVDLGAATHAVRVLQAYADLRAAGVV